jgi:uncharacterized protein YecT (DUF1311 family)
MVLTPGGRGAARRAAILVAMAACSLAPGAALGQDHAAPRRIAPDRFPDYGVHAPAARPAIPLIAPTAERPFGACSRDMPKGGWLRCLRQTAGLADEQLDALAERIKAQFSVRPNVNEILRRGWSRALDESQSRWRSLRDYECQRLAMAEPAAPKEILEAQLTCAIRHDLERGGLLAARYKLAE